MPYTPVPPYATGDEATSPEGVVDSIGRWIGNEPLGDLLGAFDGSVPTGSTAERLDALEAFSSATWDFRNGKERNLADVAELDDGTSELVTEAAEALGLRSSTRPRRASYDHVVILGGLVRACLLRPRYAAELIDDGDLTAGDVTGLTAYRPLKGDEIDLVAQVDLTDAGDEAMVMESGLVRAFGLEGTEPTERREDSDAEFGASVVRAWAPDGRDTTVRLVVAPSPEPTKRRANSADTYTWWAENVARLHSGSSVLLVTSSIYVPYQNAGAVERLGLPYGASVETVGLDFSRDDLGPLRQPFGPQQYLQEIHSAIRGARNLHARATEALRNPTPGPVDPTSGRPWGAPPSPAPGIPQAPLPGDLFASGRCRYCDVLDGRPHLKNCETRRAVTP